MRSALTALAAALTLAACVPRQAPPPLPPAIADPVPLMPAAHGPLTVESGLARWCQTHPGFVLCP